MPRPVDRSGHGVYSESWTARRVKDLRLRGELTVAEDSDVRSLGALAGTVSGDTVIGGCRSEAAVQSEVSGGSVGGFVGPRHRRYADHDGLRRRPGVVKGAGQRRGRRPWWAASTAAA